MEKLQPILKQRYWICFGLALIFVIVGWWSASGDLAIKIEERQKAVTTAFDNAKNGATDPNAKWVEAAKKENLEDTESYKMASLQLWKRQQRAREWPQQIRSEMQGIKYFADIHSKETRERWASIYQGQFENLLKIVQPFKYDTGEGLVLVNENMITHQPFNKWQYSGAPSTNEIWSNQEDIWLLKALLTSIAKTNDSATRISESQVREIKQLTLRGGDRKAKPPGAGGSGGGGMLGGMAGGMTGGMSGGMTMGEGAMYGGAGGGATHTHPGSAYEGAGAGDILAEEFGAVAGAAGMGGMGGMGAGMGSGMMSDMLSSGAGGMTGAGASASSKKEVRYVDDAEKDLGYKTRAFLLDVVIRDERLPDLLAKLTNSDFPVEIVRVEVLSRSGGSSSGMGMPGGYGGAAGGYSGTGSTDSMMEGSSGGMSSMMSSGLGNRLGTSPGAGSAGGYPGMSSGAFPGSGGGYPGSTGGYPGSAGGYPGASGGYQGESGVGGAKGAEVLQAAMADPMLIDVRIGGIMTLYMTPEESETQAKTEETAAKEDAAAAAAQTSTSTTAPGTAEPSAGPGSLLVPPVAGPDASLTAPATDNASPAADATNPAATSPEGSAASPVTPETGDASGTNVTPGAETNPGSAPGASEQTNPAGTTDPPAGPAPAP